MNAPHQQVNTEQLVRKLDQLFGVGRVSSLKRLDMGYMCQNFEVVCDSGRFFLKQYRNQFSQWVSEIKYAEQFFSDKHIPVLLPVRDKHGRPCFWFEGNWFSLFPFIEGRVPDPDTMSETTIRSLARMLAEMHKTGLDVETPLRFRPLQLWSTETFELEFIELQEALFEKGIKNTTDEKIHDALCFKRDVVRATTLKPGDIDMPNDRLLHGDFVYQNTFVDHAGEVTHLFDFEKACLGPRGYDLARAILINCFDTGWEEKHHESARIFFEEYQKVHPIDFDEFYEGMRMYLTHLVHLTWVEAKYILFGSTIYLDMHDSHMRRLRALRGDVKPFCEKLYTKESLDQNASI